MVIELSKFIKVLTGTNLNFNNSITILSSTNLLGKFTISSIKSLKSMKNCRSELRIETCNDIKYTKYHYRLNS